MEVRLYEECEDEKTISLEQHGTRFSAQGSKKHVKGGLIKFHVRKYNKDRDGCGYVEACFEECFTCEEWRRFLCELGRINCFGDPCEPYCFDELFDQDCCDDDDHGPRTVRVSVEELRKVIKGKSADDVVEIEVG